MNYQIRESNNKKYIELISISIPLSNENDAVHLIEICFENNINQLMVHYAALSQDFFNLKTKAAGNILQKFINYNIKVVTIIPDEIMQKGRFREMAIETNKGNHFRMYNKKEDAEIWLLS